MTGVSDQGYVTEPAALPRATFRRPEKTRVIRFEEPHELAGLVMRTRGMSVDALLQVTGFSRLAVLISEGAIAADPGDTAIVFRTFADRLIEWNMVELDDVTPVPTTLEGVCSLDVEYANLIIREWMKALSGVSDDLKDASSSGGTMAVVPLPMDSL